MDIEPSMNKNQHLYKQLHGMSTQSKVQVGIFNNMPGGLALASNPLGLVPVATAQHQLARPRIGWVGPGLVLPPLASVLVGSALHRRYCHLSRRIDYLNIEPIIASAPHWLSWPIGVTATCLGELIIESFVASAPDWLGWPQIGVTSTCLRELII